MIKRKNSIRDLTIMRLYLEGVSIEDLGKHYDFTKYYIKDILNKQPRYLRRFMFESKIHQNDAKTLEQFLDNKEYWLLIIDQMTIALNQQLQRNLK